MNQLDFLGLPLDAAMTRHLAGKVSFPVPREVRKPRLRDVLGESRDLSTTNPCTRNDDGR